MKPVPKALTKASFAAKCFPRNGIFNSPLSFLYSCNSSDPRILFAKVS
ncbi:uncharacterized protein METZ01_LOCUS134287 [marine metagenome]|uniref:Uncharacterized protein n=1 Tax=marine metagenome TaxID=408172 RepID=A0A381YXY0_9ZZZZ